MAFHRRRKRNDTITRSLGKKAKICNAPATKVCYSRFRVV